MSSTLTPNMSLIIPGVGTQGGPQYAQDVNDSLTILDQHSHTPGSGVQITPEAINITSALSFNSNPATTLSYVNLTPQVSAAPINSLYEKGVDLYYRDGNGNEVQMTTGGGVAGTPGSISNLVPPASVTYVGASQTFVFQSNTNIAANLDAGSILLRNLAPNSTYALTLSPPASLSSDYTVTLPSLPIAASFLTMSTAGAITGSIATSKGITASNIADGTITGALIANATIPASALAFTVTQPLQTVTVSATGSWQVPASITAVIVTAVGGGGGGAGGLSGAGGGNGGGGGGGGGASGQVNVRALTTTPGEFLSITVGAGGSAGSIGGAGGTGGTTTVSGANGLLRAAGGLGGSVGTTGAGGAGLGGAGGAQSLIYAQYNNPGGKGSATAGAFNPAVGGDSIYASGGAIGAQGPGNNEDGGAGGGGGAGLGNGGNGGKSGNTSGGTFDPGGAGTAGTLGGGGGGGGGGRDVSSGGAGGAGGAGAVYITYAPKA